MVVLTCVWVGGVMVLRSVLVVYSWLSCVIVEYNGALSGSKHWDRVYLSGALCDSVLIFLWSFTLISHTTCSFILICHNINTQLSYTMSSHPHLTSHPHPQHTLISCLLDISWPVVLLLEYCCVWLVSEKIIHVPGRMRNTSSSLNWN